MKFRLIIKVIRRIVIVFLLTKAITFFFFTRWLRQISDENAAGKAKKNAALPNPQAKKGVINTKINVNTVDVTKIDMRLIINDGTLSLFFFQKITMEEKNAVVRSTSRIPL